MRRLTESEIDELANALETSPAICPKEIGLDNDKKCEAGIWTTSCKDCWKSALERVRIAEVGE